MPTSPFTGYIARAVALSYEGDPRKTTAHYMAQAKGLECKEGAPLLNAYNQQTAVAVTHDAAVDLIRQQVGDMLRNTSRLEGAFVAADWRIQIHTEEVTAGLFWPEPSRCATGMAGVTPL